MTRTTIETPTSGTLSVQTAGTGPALILLHRSLGADSLADLSSALELKFSVVVPSMPGYDDSDRPDWARSPRDLAAILAHAVPPLCADRPVLVGLGLGGWVAAEMAATSAERFRALVLVAPLGVQPLDGEITDPFLVSTDRYVEMGFVKSDDYHRTFAEYEIGSEPWIRRERNREMTTRIAWRPRMFDSSLPHRLPHAGIPTLVVWGDGDKILPRDAVERYAAAIPGAELVVLPNRGHMLECESASDLADLISSFAANQE